MRCASLHMALRLAGGVRFPRQAGAMRNCTPGRLSATRRVRLCSLCPTMRAMPCTASISAAIIAVVAWRTGCFGRKVKGSFPGRSAAGGSNHEPSRLLVHSLPRRAHPPRRQHGHPAPGTGRRTYSVGSTARRSPGDEWVSLAWTQEFADLVAAAFRPAAARESESHRRPNSTAGGPADHSASVGSAPRPVPAAFHRRARLL